MLPTPTTIAGVESEGITVEEAPAYEGPPLPVVDLTQATFDPRAQAAYAAWAAARDSLNGLVLAEQSNRDAVAFAQLDADAARVKLADAIAATQTRWQSIRSVAVRAYMSDQSVAPPEDGRAAYMYRLAMRKLFDDYRADTRSIDRLRVAADEADARVVAAQSAVRRDDTAVEAARGYAASLEATLRLYAVGATGVPVGFRFPISAAYTFGNSWGAPRMVGTSYEHSHEGVDVFATFGAPLVAVEDGWVAKAGTDSLGGIKLWLIGVHSGNRYYYAHLSRFADGVTSGTAVKAGQPVGFVGDSGNAKGGAAHLHFEVHPDGGRAVNPYPLLVVASTGDPNNLRPR